jgi:RNA polymerase sigma-70 factor (ECF subfamily)
MFQQSHSIETQKFSGRAEPRSPEDPVQAFEAIVRDYSDSLMRFIYSRVRSLPDAEDICQETFLKAFQGRKSFDGHSSLKTWLFCIAYRQIISFLRKKKLPTSGQIHWVTAESVPAPSQDQNEENIWHLAQKLSPEQYTLLWLKYKEDLSTAEIARILGKSRLNIRVMLHRARLKLADILRRDSICRDHPAVRPVPAAAYPKGASHVL